MSDDSFIREVDDEMRQDRAKNLWDKYGKFLILSAVAIVVATGGYRAWEYFQAQEAAGAGDRFMEAIQLSSDGKHDDAIVILQSLENEGSGQYPALAKMRIASETAARGDLAQAIAAFDAIAVDSSNNDTFILIAKLRAGLLAVDVNGLEDVVKRLQPLAGPGLAFRHSAREGLGLANYKAGQYGEALKWFNEIVNDAQSTANVRSRANIMIELLAGKGITSKTS